MNHGLKLLLMAAGAIVTCVVVVVGFQLTKSGKSDTVKAKEQYTSITNTYDDVQLVAYDDLTITGVEVVNFMKTYDVLLCSEKYDFMVYVKTIENPEGVTYDATYKDKLNKHTSVEFSMEKEYINPVGKFKCSIGRNENKVIKSVTFVQQK